MQQKLVAVGGAVCTFIASAGVVLAQVPTIDLTPTAGSGFASSADSYINTIVSVVFVIGALLISPTSSTETFRPS